MICFAKPNASRRVSVALIYLVASIVLINAQVCVAWWEAATKGGAKGGSELMDRIVIIIMVIFVMNC
jgi:hypothetical protein